MKRRTIVILCSLVAPFALASIILLVRIQAEAFYWGVYRGLPLEKDLGFSHGSPYVKIGDSRWGTEVMTLEDIKPGGVFDQAGVKEGDILLDDLSITEFFRMLERSRGKTVTIKVVPSGNGPPLKQRPIREVIFEVPSAK